MDVVVVVLVVMEFPQVLFNDCYMVLGLLCRHHCKKRKWKFFRWIVAMITWYLSCSKMMIHRFVLTSATADAQLDLTFCFLHCLFTVIWVSL